MFSFVRLPPSQWRSVRTTNAIERLHEEFKRRIKTQTVLPSADTAAMLFWALLASGQINMRKVDGWQTLASLLRCLLSYEAGGWGCCPLRCAACCCRREKGKCDSRKIEIKIAGTIPICRA